MKRNTLLIFFLAWYLSSFAQKAPDYSDLKYWAAIPLKKNITDSVPAFLKNEIRTNQVDVFYIHPTTFLKKIFTAAWNADVDDEDLNSETDNTAIKSQATIFNGSCKVYAPRYRQAHLKAFIMKNNPNASRALDLAYADIRSAFIYYLQNYNKGRPIIIAGHSQGSRMGMLLLKEFFDGKPLFKQLVCAYLPGSDIDKDQYKTIHEGKTPDETGCILVWRTYKKDATNLDRPSSTNMCVNPISWTVSTKPTDPAMHKGMLYPDFNTLTKNVVVAEIDNNNQVVRASYPSTYDSKLGKFNNLHIWDMRLFYMDIRENVKQRIAAFLKTNH